jgi:hypothetical protein
MHDVCILTLSEYQLPVDSSQIASRGVSEDQEEEEREDRHVPGYIVSSNKFFNLTFVRCLSEKLQSLYVIANTGCGIHGIRPISHLG